MLDRFLAFWLRSSGGSDGKRLSTMWETPGFDPWVGKFPGEGNGNPLQYSCLENPMDGGAWCPWGHKELDTTERLHFLAPPGKPDLALKINKSQSNVLRLGLSALK